MQAPIDDGPGGAVLCPAAPVLIPWGLPVNPTHPGTNYFIRQAPQHTSIRQEGAWPRRITRNGRNPSWLGLRSYEYLYSYHSVPF